jgi:hypothetical protein
MPFTPFFETLDGKSIWQIVGVSVTATLKEQLYFNLFMALPRFSLSI